MSGYQFFYPFHVGGESEFYEQLQKFDWYYMPWKWEHKLSLSYINQSDRVLEIGCATGDFLDKVRTEKQAKVFGLELNKSALSELEKKNIDFSSDTMQEFSVKNSEQFDRVCSYQVLEHISDVNSFLKSSISVLKEVGW